MKVRKLKIDAYCRARGGTYTLYNIYCDYCKQRLFLYRKDGKGILKRLYIDRIHKGSSVFGTCINCEYVFGVPDIYKREKRPCIRLFVGSVVKKKIKK